MKILVFNTVYFPNRKGGAEKSVQLICEQLIKKNNNVTVISIWDEKSKKKQNINGVQSEKWPKANLYSVHNYGIKKTGALKKITWQIIDIFNIKMFIKAFFYIRNSDFDIIWTNNLSGFSVSIWLAAYLNKRPIIHTARDYYLLSNNVQLYNKKNLPIKHNIFSYIKTILLKKTSKCLSAFIGISEYIHEKHKPFLDSKLHNFSSIYNPISLNEETRKNEYIYSFIKKNIYGYIGQINEAKGVDKMIENFIKNSTKSLLLIAGNDTQNYKEKYKKYNRIYFLDFIEANQFYKKINYLLVPSLWEEPFGRIVVEAINHKKCVFSTSKGGLNELSKLFFSVKKFNFDTEFDYDNNHVSFDLRDTFTLNNNFSTEVITNKYISIFNKIKVSRKCI